MKKSKSWLHLTLLLICGMILTGASNCIAGDNVVGHWQFNDAANPGKDSSAAGNDLTINGKPIVKDGAISLRGGTVKLPGAERDFLYSNSSDFDLGNESFTVECWFKSQAITYMELVGTRSTIRPIYPLQVGWALGISKGKGGIIFVINDNRKNCTWATIKVGKSSWDGDEWNYLVGIRDRKANTIKLYLNGKLVDTKTDGCGDITKSKHLRIGYDAYAGWLTEGMLKNIRISKGITSTAEIARHYKQETASQATGKQIILKDNRVIPDKLKVDISDGLNGKLNLQPQPVNFNCSQQYTALKTPLYIQLPTKPTAQQLIAKDFLVRDFKSRLNLTVKTVSTGKKTAGGTIIKLSKSFTKDHSESYRLKCNATGITLTSVDHGIIYGALTLIQIFEQSSLIQQGKISIPTQFDIYDYPAIPRRIQVRLLTKKLTDSDAEMHKVMQRITRTRLNYYAVNIMYPETENIKRIVDIADEYGIKVLGTVGYMWLCHQYGRAAKISDIKPIVDKLTAAAKIGCQGFSFHFDDLGKYRSAAAKYAGTGGEFQRQFLVAMQQVAAKYNIKFLSMCPTMYMRDWQDKRRLWFGKAEKCQNYFATVSQLPGGDIELFYTDIGKQGMQDIRNRGVKYPAYYLNGLWPSSQWFSFYTGPSRLSWSWYGFNVDPVKGPQAIPEIMQCWKDIAKDKFESVWVGNGSFLGSMTGGIWLWNPAAFNENAAVREVNRVAGLGAGTFTELLVYEKNILPLVSLFKTYINKWTSEFHVVILKRKQPLNAADLIVYWKNYQAAEQAFKTIKAIINRRKLLAAPYKEAYIPKGINQMQSALAALKPKLIRKLNRKNIVVK
ncbi:MAG: beta-N-acetylglucosaminidase domain-containing protein [Victivallaceae bacterium]|nr:beta-N-acetylglucosaminidase domain-containing protein [Victivallaceae bacterium]